MSQQTPPPTDPQQVPGQQTGQQSSQQPPQQQPEQSAQSPQTPTDPPPTSQQPPPSSGQGQDMASLPEWAQKQIRDLRKEAGDHRTSKNTAETKHQETLDAIAQALGLKANEPPDPAKLAEQVTGEQAKARQAQTHLAVYRRAAGNGANPDALLDSASFLTSLDDVDLSTDDAVDAAIKTAVEKNPNLAAQRVVPGSRDAAQGANATSGGQTINDLLRAAAGR